MRFSQDCRHLITVSGDRWASSLTTFPPLIPDLRSHVEFTVFAVLAASSCGSWIPRWRAPWGRGGASERPRSPKPAAPDSKRTSGETPRAGQRRVNVDWMTHWRWAWPLFQKRDLHHHALCSDPSSDRGGGGDWPEDSSQTGRCWRWGVIHKVASVLKQWKKHLRCLFFSVLT